MLSIPNWPVATNGSCSKIGGESIATKYVLYPDIYEKYATGEIILMFVSN